MGAEVSMLTSQDRTDRVSGGAMRGSRLFHSFQALNVGEGRSLYFMQPAGISQIFSRITGDQPSNILGMLGVLGNADLFLLNPNGLLFGPNSRLDLAGSFVGSTAESWVFDGFEFGAIAPQPVPLLTVNAPVGLQLGQAPGRIVNQSIADGVGLTVQPFQTLALIGGDLELPGGRITVPSGQIELGSVRNGRVDWTVAANPLARDRLTFGYEGALERGAIALSEQASVIASQVLGNRASRTQVVAQDLSLVDRSTIVAETSGAFQGASLGFDLANLTVDVGSQILSRTTGPERGGEIGIEASDSIDLRRVSLRNPIAGNGIISQSAAAGAGGAITVNTQQLSLWDGSRIESAAWSTGAGGDIAITVADTLLARGVNPQQPSFPAGITPNTFGAAAGGNLRLTARNVMIQDGANIITGVISNRDELVQLPANAPFRSLLGKPGAGTGTSGDIQIVADHIVIEGANSLAPDTPSQLGSLTLGSGNTGDVSVTANLLQIRQGGLLLSSAVPSVSSLGNPLPNSGTGNVGQLVVRAKTIEVSGANPFFTFGSTLGTQTFGQGNAGETIIQTEQLSVLEGGTVTSGTFTAGNSGQLTIDATQSIDVAGIHGNGLPASIATSANMPDAGLAQALFILNPVPSGDTGELVIRSDRLRIADGGVIGVRHQGTGDAGDMRIRANQVLLTQGGRLSAETQFGMGGNIGLTIQESLLLRGGSTITAEAFGALGDGGNIMLDAGVIIALPAENSDIIANAQGGDGGNISLRTGRLLGLEFQEQLTPKSDVTASSEIGLNGTVNIDLLAVDPNPGRIELSTALLTADEEIATDCRRTTGSSFIASGRGGLPADPRHKLFAQPGLQDWRGAVMDARRLSRRNPLLPRWPQSAAPVPPKDSLIEAEGWLLDSENTIQLVSRSQENLWTSIKRERSKTCSVLRSP